MAAYSLDLRERIVEAVERRVGSNRKIAALFGVHESFLYKLLRQKRERGDIAPLPHGGGARGKLSQKQLRQLPGWVAAIAGGPPPAPPGAPREKGRGAASPTQPCCGGGDRR